MFTEEFTIHVNRDEKTKRISIEILFPEKLSELTDEAAVEEAESVADFVINTIGEKIADDFSLENIQETVLPVN